MTPTSPSTLPDGHLVSWYGDDLTGAAAVLEVLAIAGLPSVLFMDIPTADEIAPFESWPGIGLAGTARHRDPQWMKEHLPRAFEFLASLSAPISHYKVCSTLDSSPTIGSIGVAADIAGPILGGDWTPLVIAAPPIGRYQMFGNLFAVADGVVYRLDRHPTMSRHPVTPMKEADVRKHLVHQTATPLGLVDAVSLRSGSSSEALDHQLQEGNSIIALDVVDDTMLGDVGRLMWENKGDRILAIGSQGVEYALVRYWSEQGMIKPVHDDNAFGPARQIAAVSASMSPITAAQLEWAGANGFDLLRMNVGAVLDTLQWQHEIDRVTDDALDSIREGGSPIIYTARGPDDPSAHALRSALAHSSTSSDEALERIGVGLGHVLDRLVRLADISRCAVVGGDTSGHVTRSLGIRSLTFMAPIGHGTAMMRANGASTDRPELQYILKGGQMGPVDFFGKVRDLQSAI